jgi:hypothetical protein
MHKEMPLTLWRSLLINSTATISDITPSCTTKLAFEIAEEISKHDVKVTTLKEVNPSQKTGWRVKRALCIEKGCNSEMSKYCECCNQGRKDQYWLM